MEKILSIIKNEFILRLTKFKYEFNLKVRLIAYFSSFLDSSSVRWRLTHIEKMKKRLKYELSYIPKVKKPKVGDIKKYKNDLEILSFLICEIERFTKFISTHNNPKSPNKKINIEPRDVINEINQLKKEAKNPYININYYIGVKPAHLKELSNILINKKMIPPKLKDTIDRFNECYPSVNGQTLIYVVNELYKIRYKLTIKNANHDEDDLIELLSNVCNELHTLIIQKQYKITYNLSKLSEIHKEEKINTDSFILTDMLITIFKKIDIPTEIISAQDMRCIMLNLYAYKVSLEKDKVYYPHKHKKKYLLSILDETINLINDMYC